MNFHHEHAEVLPQHGLASGIRSPVASERVRSLAERIIEGAPALTFGEMRELAEAILEHNFRSDMQGA